MDTLRVFVCSLLFLLAAFIGYLASEVAQTCATGEEVLMFIFVMTLINAQMMPRGRWTLAVAFICIETISYYGFSLQYGTTGPAVRYAAGLGLLATGVLAHWLRMFATFYHERMTKIEESTPL